jgi:peptidoglycan/LPS O-acetylase OafA/YrhL
MQLPRNINTLTGIRGFAVLWVVLFHLKTNACFLSFCTPGEFIKHGFWGVDIFFVLSGFVLTHVYENAFAKEVSTKAYLHFLGLRLARMYPLHIVTFFAALAFALLSHAIGQGTVNPKLYDAFLHLTLVHAWGTTQEGSYNIVSWAISAEWFAYLFLLVPCVRYLRKAPLKLLYPITGIAWCLLIFVYVPLTPSKLVNMTYDFGILRMAPEFLGGYVAYRTVKAMRGKLRFPDLASLTGLAGIIAISYHSALQVLLLPAIMLLVIGLSAEGRVTSSVLANRVSLYLGELSYAIYMCHYILLWVVDGVLKRTSLPTNMPWIGLGVITVYLALMFLISYVLYTLVEQPCRDWARKKLDVFFSVCTSTEQVRRPLTGTPRNSVSTERIVQE